MILFISRIKVRLNEFDLKKTTIEQFDAKIEDVIIHEAYNQLSQVNDIGLIRVDRPVTFDQYIRPVCLPFSEDLSIKPNDVVIAAGWGEIGSAHGIGKYLYITKHIPSINYCHKNCRCRY